MSASFGIRKTITDPISASLGNNELKNLGQRDLNKKNYIKICKKRILNFF